MTVFGGRCGKTSIREAVRSGFSGPLPRGRGVDSFVGGRFSLTFGLGVEPLVCAEGRGGLGVEFCVCVGMGGRRKLATQVKIKCFY